jgi:hypothetical protein
MYLVAIAWMYVVLMMALAEATSKQGTVLGAVFTFLLYGVGPLGLVLYLLGTPGRRQRQRALEQEADAALAEQPALADTPGPASAVEPDRCGEPASDGVAPVRKEP